jgi:cytochrome c556
VLLACAAIVVADEDFDPEPIIQGRQAGLRDIGAAFKGIGDELKAPAPSLATIQYNAKQIEELAKQQRFWFPAGTGPESEIDTQAKPGIWSAGGEFKAAQDAMSEHARKLVQVAAGGDVASIRAQWRELGGTCKSCHDRFREEDD